MITDYKINTFQKPVASLADAPELSAQELKAYFDASPEECRAAVNGAIDTLTAAEGAQNIGFQESDSIHAATVQQAIENVQGQIKNVALGQIPEGSVDETRLSEAVLQKWTQETDERLTQDIELANRINTVQTSLTTTSQTLTNSVAAARSRADSAYNLANAKSQFILGSYVGDGKSSQNIVLGFKPRVLFVVGWGRACGPISNIILSGVGGCGISLMNNGFQAQDRVDNSVDKIVYEFNELNGVYQYMALK